MKTVQMVFWIHLITAVAALSIGYAAFSLEAALIVVFFGGLWYFAQLRGARGLETLIFFGFGLAATAGFWLGLSSLLLLLAVVATLGAWDLDHFSQRLRAVSRVDMETGLGRDHLRRLLLIETLGLLSGVVALTTRTQIGFWTAVLLVIVALFGISRLILYLKKELEQPGPKE